MTDGTPLGAPVDDALVASAVSAEQADRRDQARAQREHLIKTEGKPVNRLIRGAYGVVLLTALVGQTTGVMGKLHLPWFFAGPAMFATELLAVVFASVAEYRRKLGEQALASRALAFGFAAFAVWVNWYGHADQSVFLAGFFSVFSAAGFCVWLLSSAFSRRDHLWLTGKLDEPPPVYGPIQWLTHPWLTRRAKALATADPSLGRTGSLAAAVTEAADRRRRSAIVSLARKDMGRALGPEVAELIITIADPDRLAREIEALADWQGIAQVYAARIDPSRLGGPAARAAAGRKPAADQTGGRTMPAPVATPDQTGLPAATGPGAQRTGPVAVEQTRLRSVAAGPSRATVRGVVGTQRRTGGQTDQTSFGPQAIRDAAAARTEWPDGLPESGAHSLLKKTFGWGSQKATNALSAYLAAADLSESEGAR